MKSRDKKKARKDSERRDMAFFDTDTRLPTVRAEVWDKIAVQPALEREGGA